MAGAGRPPRRGLRGWLTTLLLGSLVLGILLFGRGILAGNPSGQVVTTPAPTDTSTPSAPPTVVPDTPTFTPATRGVTINVAAVIADVRQHWGSSYQISCDRSGIISVDPGTVFYCRYSTSVETGTFRVTVHANGGYDWSAGVPDNRPAYTANPYQTTQPPPQPVCNPILSISLSYASAISVDGVNYAGNVVNLHVSVGSHAVVVTSPQYDGQYHIINYYHHSYTINVPCSGYRWSG